MTGWRLAVTIGSLLLLSIILQYRLWVGPVGLYDMLGLKQQLVKQTEKNTLLKRENDELLFQVQRLQKSRDAIEARARSELGMIKKGETFYQVVK